ncbi:MAG: hypothetical protein A2063_08500 [Gallionellales bacterium GWA2_60_142]|jgi:uncharacterized protein|nr:MAG: hypothetical protein A2063_08500 [Gallionellales bacterium GWA2_60_142]HCI12657.1 hypothetical protein [Gallionellaceae bacterium]
MSRLLLLVVIAAVVYLLIRSYRRKSEAADKEVVTEDMVRCAHCGVHLPRSESIKAGDKFYCSAEHRDAARG